MNLVELWLRKDVFRWLAGAMAGLFAAALALIAAILMAGVFGYELWFPIKLFATILLGPSATEFGMNLRSLVVGIAVVEMIGAVLGVLYAHFTQTNLLQALLGIGLVWGLFSWIFIWCLFLPSFKVIRYAGVSAAPAFFVCVIFGLALTSVAFFDRALRRSSL